MKRIGANAVGVVALLCLCAEVQAQRFRSGPPAAAAPPAAASTPAANLLPTTKMAPAKLFPGICLVHYRISTTSDECQQFFDQGLAYLYSYVWIEAARSMETATQKDPECAMAWWGLSRALERSGKGDANKACQKASELAERASHREQQLILCRMQEKGLAPNVGDAEARKRAAIKTLDEMLAIYDDDEEAWYYRAQLAGGSGLFGGQAGSVPFYKALLKVNPLHPGANHELVHFYEMFRRPALGWVYSENYIKSSPGIPHAFHMQSHLATRLGRWDTSSKSSSKAIELQRQYHKDMGVKPTEDGQFAHHLEVLLLSLIHDGRFREAETLKKEAWDIGFRNWVPWFRLHMAERNFDEALKIADQQRKGDKTLASYMSALVYLAQNDPVKAAPYVEVLEEAHRDRKNDRALKQRLWEARGLLLCQTDGPDAGLGLLQKCVKETIDDYSHHAWGNGAYYMEAWGLAALQCERFEVAEEAFLEALAHDSGSVRAALGLQAMCEKLGRKDEAEQYRDLARRFWRSAEVQTFDSEWASIRSRVSQTAAKSVPTSIPTAGTNGP